jgi:hypothetical protein
MTTDTTGTIWGRVIDPDTPGFSPEAARSILALQFPPADVDRMNDLAAKARAGTLTPAEDEELENYLQVSQVLTILQSKARRSIRAAEQP